MQIVPGIFGFPSGWSTHYPNCSLILRQMLVSKFEEFISDIESVTRIILFRTQISFELKSCERFGRMIFRIRLKI